LSILAETVDPDGRVVVLDEDGWEHILHEHPELALRPIVVSTRAPDGSATTAAILALAAGCSWSYTSTRHQRES
jgi:hypothetical protein